MSDEINTSKPNVGIRGNPESLKPLKSAEYINASTSVPNYGDALNALATTPSMLGVVGSSIMNNTSIALANKFGRSLGENPQGNLLPPITDFDKNVGAAYTAESQVILGNHATAMLYKGQEELAKANKLTPDMIASYKSNMGEGLKQTLELAPDSIKPQLENQFIHQLNSSAHEYNMKLLSQNKADAESNAQVWRTHQNDLVTNQVKDAKTKEEFELAKQTYESLQQNISASNLTPAQKDTALTTAKLNYESAISINKLLSARASGKADEYLASLAGKKINGLSWSESEQVTANTVKYISAIEMTENRDQNLIMSGATLDMAQGTFNESKLADLRDQLREENYNKVATQWAVSQKKRNTENIAAQEIISEPGNAIRYAGKTPKQINQAFDYLKSAVIQQNPGIPEDEADYRVASAMNTVVPKYIDKINREMANGNPQQVLAALEAYERTHELDGNKVLGISDKSLMTGEIFKNMLANQNVDSELALQKAREIVYNKDENIIKNNNAIINDYMSRHASTPTNRLSNAIKLSGIPTDVPLDNQSAFEADVYSRFNGYMQMSNGDTAASEARVKKDLAKIYGTTKVNGKKQITRLGIEQAISVPTDAAPLIQEDIISQLEPQLMATKELFNKGGTNHYWRIKEGRTTYNEAAKAKLNLDSQGLRDPEYATHVQTIKKFKKGEPIIIEQVTRNGITEWQLDVQSSPYAQRSPVTQQVSGYNIGIIHPETGEKGQLYGFYGATHTIPTYTPNENLIRKNYIGLNNLQGLTPEEYIQNKMNQGQPKDITEYRQNIIRNR